ncbi:MAG: Mut7-C RNAse domain-containing protein [Candidatus Thermoplasmatota archaeon]|nr:Mut7-C RNAse domain-containing protein [Candidatus Thermoplasmatota archaeon]
MKFLCDQMLGSLAKWLRLMGFDTFYANADMDDDELLQVAKKENRVVITRDKELMSKMKKQKLPVIELDVTDVDEQLKIVLKDIVVDPKNVLSRCSVCNTILDEIKKKDIQDKVPRRVFENNEKFWFCPKCDKIYWMGTHYDKIKNKIDELQKH